MKGTSKCGIEYNGKTSIKVELYTDARFANTNEQRKSITCYVSILASACITWKSIKQDCLSLQTEESELVAASKGIREAIWLRLLLKELGYDQGLPTQCWCDNTAEISIIKDPCSHLSTNT